MKLDTAEPIEQPICPLPGLRIGFLHGGPGDGAQSPRRLFFAIVARRPFFPIIQSGKEVGFPSAGDGYGSAQATRPLAWASL
jgi:hypothetical protein